MTFQEFMDSSRVGDLVRVVCNDKRYSARVVMRSDGEKVVEIIAEESAPVDDPPEAL